MSSDPEMDVEGIKRLIGAVLIRAFDDLRQMGVLRSDYRGSNLQRFQRDALYWFFTDAPDEPYSFSWCCDHLDLCPERLRRRALAEMTTVGSRPVRRYRRQG